MYTSRVAAIIIRAMLASLALSGAVHAESRAQCPDPLLELDFDGSIVSGSRRAVIDATQRGERLRIGWDLDFDDDSKSDLSHWSDALFLSVWQGNVFTQVQSIHRQRPVRDGGAMDLPDEPEIWHGLIGTTGVLQGRFERTGPVTATNVRSVWCSAAPAWRPVYRSGRNGESLAGSKQALLDAIRAGLPIRIGWGLEFEIDGDTRSVEHVAVPDFLTVVNGTDVVAQLPEHIAQQSYVDSAKSRFDDGAVLWRGLLSSTGQFDAIWVNRASGDVVRRMPQRAQLTWYIQGVEPGPRGTLAVESGVTLDADTSH